MLYRVRDTPRPMDLYLDHLLLIASPTVCLARKTDSREYGIRSEVRLSRDLIGLYLFSLTFAAILYQWRRTVDVHFLPRLIVVFVTATIRLNLRIRFYVFRKFVPHVVNVITARSQ